MNKGFIQIPLIMIIIGSLAVASLGAGFVLHKSGKLSNLGASISNIFNNKNDAELELERARLDIEKAKQENALLQIELEKQRQSQTPTPQMAKPETSRIKAASQTVQPSPFVSVATPTPTPIPTPTPNTPKTFSTPSGAVVDEFGNIISSPQVAITPQATSIPQETPVQTPSALSTAQVATLVSPSVVLISTSEGSGSGFVISAGVGKFILTNAHVVKGKSSVKIYAQNGTEFNGTILGRDEIIDLAIISTSGHDLPSLILGTSNSSSLAIGENVYALGFPLSISAHLVNMTFTAGVLSSRQWIKLQSNFDSQLMLQIDASLNPGNSGGPLVNNKGEVIGINTAVISSAQSIGFAIPIDTAKTLIPKLLQGLQNVIFEPPAIGSTITISRTMVAGVVFNPTLSCEDFGYMGNNLIICNLYKNHRDTYQWNIIN